MIVVAGFVFILEVAKPIKIIIVVFHSEEVTILRLWMDGYSTRCHVMPCHATLPSPNTHTHTRHINTENTHTLACTICIYSHIHIESTSIGDVYNVRCCKEHIKCCTYTYCRFCNAVCQKHIVLWLCVRCTALYTRQDAPFTRAVGCFQIPATLRPNSHTSTRCDVARRPPEEYHVVRCFVHKAHTTHTYIYRYGVVYDHAAARQHNKGTVCMYWQSKSCQLHICQSLAMQWNARMEQWCARAALFATRDDGAHTPHDSHSVIRLLVSCRYFASHGWMDSMACDALAVQSNTAHGIAPPARHGRRSVFVLEKSNTVFGVCTMHAYVVCVCVWLWATISRLQSHRHGFEGVLSTLWGGGGSLQCAFLTGVLNARSEYLR